jgi:hypothetical protein
VKFGSSETGSGKISARHPLLISARIKSLAFAATMNGRAWDIMARSIDIIVPSHIKCSNQIAVE